MERQSPRHYPGRRRLCGGYGDGLVGADASGTTVQEGETFAYHSYSFMTYLPPNAAIPGGRAPNGCLFTPGRGSMCAGGQRGTRQSHKLALGLGLHTPYEMHGSPVPRNAGHFFALYDSTRRHVVWYGYSGDSNPRRNLYYMDVYDASQGEYTWQLRGDAIFPYYCIGSDAKKDDVYLITRLTKSSLILWVFDPKTLTPLHAGTPGCRTGAALRLLGRMG